MLLCGAGCCLWIRGLSGRRARRSLRRPPRRWRWGFALHKALRGRVAGVSDPRVVQFPPFGGSEAVCSPNCRPIG